MELALIVLVWVAAVTLFLLGLAVFTLLASYRNLIEAQAQSEKEIRAAVEK